VTTAPSMPLLHDVTLRDGLMSLAPLDHGLKRAIAAGLVAAGVCHLEIIRFPIDGRYPQFDDGLALLADLQPLRLHGAVFAAFAVGDAGIDAALVHAGLYDELHVPCFVSDAYAAYAFASWRWRDSLDQISRARRRCDDAGVRLTVGLGTAFGCPLTPGPPHSDATVAAFRDLVALEPAAIMLGDTAGQASPGMVAEVLARIAEGADPCTGARTLPQHIRARATQQRRRRIRRHRRPSMSRYSDSAANRTRTSRCPAPSTMATARPRS
jgi:isopropylmalate/homocitrate/citramalate synthase